MKFTVIDHEFLRLSSEYHLEVRDACKSKG